jgi:hypothetical protein
MELFADATYFPGDGSGRADFDPRAEAFPDHIMKGTGLSRRMGHA